MTPNAIARPWMAPLAVALMLATAAPARADVVTDWNDIAVGIVASTAGRSPFIDIAKVQAAVHDAVQSYQGRFEPYAGTVPGASGSMVAAVATAARDVLVDLFPSQTAAINTTYTNYLAAQGLGVGDAGVTVGHQAALNVLIKRANDGSYPANPEVFLGGTAPGEWRPTPPGFAPMQNPWVGQVRPYALRDTGRLLPEPPPPALTSGAYAKDYNEVKALGARVGSARTPEQTDIGYFYTDNYPRLMNRALRAIAAAHVPDSGDRARLFALANIATADAIISSWGLKRDYYFWRPSTAIKEGDDDGNAQTSGDAAWLPLVNDPPYPDYTSGANSIAGAMTRILRHYFGTDTFTFDMTSTVAQVVQKTRTYTSFSAMADNVEDGRVYSGVHFRFADVVGRRQGKQSADWTFSHILRPLR